MTELRFYQEQAVVAALEHSGYGIWCEQRTGKCLISLTVAVRRKVEYLLIITVKKGIRVWKEEIEKHYPGRPWIVRIMNFERIHSNRDELRTWLSKGPTSMVIIDESHRIKSRGGKQSRACRYIAWKQQRDRMSGVSEWLPVCDYRLALTGTPIAQGRQDVWAQFAFLDPTILGPWSIFAEKYLKFGGFKNKKIVGFLKPREFDKIFHEYSFRVTLREVREESLLIRRSVIRFDLEFLAREIYREYETDLEEEAASKKPLVKNILDQAMKLQQITGGFIVTDGEPTKVSRQKKEKALGSLQKIRAQGKRVIICCRFLHEIEDWKRTLDVFKISHRVIAGGIEFDGRFDVEIVLIQVQAGIAIDLKEADVLMFYSWDHSFINHEQMKFRILTYDKRQVHYIYLVARDTIDELFYESMRRKKNLSTLVLDQYRRQKNRGQKSETSSRAVDGRAPKTARIPHN